MNKKPASQFLPSGWVRIATVMSIPAVLADLGFPAAELLGEIGVELALFADPDNVIPYDLRSSIIDHCVAKTQCKHFGLLIGQRAEASTLGLVGYLARNSPNAGSALRAITRYAHLHVRGALIYLEEQNEMAFLGYSITQPRQNASQQIEDGALAIAFNVMRKLCGPAWLPACVYLRHRAPANIRPYQQFFNAPLQFDSDRNGLSFPSKWLAHPVSGADPELHRLLLKQIEHLDELQEGDFLEQVRHVLDFSLLRQNTKIEHVAAMLSLHPRTLARRLKSSDTNFHELLEQRRFSVAQQLLKSSAMDISQMATTLGYTDASTFIRAFRRWSGETPARWRALCGNDSEQAALE